MVMLVESLSALRERVLDDGPGWVEALDELLRRSELYEAALKKRRTSEPGELVVYTTTKGGPMTVEWSTRKEYDEAVRTGKWLKKPVGVTEEYLDLAMIAIANSVDLHDFHAAIRKGY